MGIESGVGGEEMVGQRVSQHLGGEA